MSGPEAKLQRAIIDRLSYDRDVMVLRVNAGAMVLGEGKGRRMFRGAPAGTSDLLLCVRDQWGAGFFCALEVKAKRGRLTDKQAAFQDRVRELGGFACVVRSVDDAVAAVKRCKEGETE